jgi:hypothetical protein
MLGSDVTQTSNTVISAFKYFLIIDIPLLTNPLVLTATKNSTPKPRI